MPERDLTPYCIRPAQPLLDAAGITSKVGESVPQDHAIFEEIARFVRDEANLRAVFGDSGVDLRDVTPELVLGNIVSPFFLTQQCRPRSFEDLPPEAFPKGTAVMVSRPFLREDEGSFLEFIRETQGHSWGGRFAASVVQDLEKSHRVYPYRDGFVSCVSSESGRLAAYFLERENLVEKVPLHGSGSIVNVRGRSGGERCIDRYMFVLSVAQLTNGTLIGSDEAWALGCHRWGEKTKSEAGFAPSVRAVEVTPQGTRDSRHSMWVSQECMWVKELMRPVA